MDTGKYILELLKNGMWVFPIRGKGRDIREAKKPLSFKEGDEIITWKNEKILTYSEELAKKNHYAWAIWLMGSERFGFDIDIYKSDLPNNEKERLRKILLKFCEIQNNIYSETSGRGGIHLITYAPNDRKLREESDYEWIEYKHDGYFIIYPTVLRTPQGDYRYQRINGDILSTLEYHIVVAYLEEIFSKFFGRPITIRVEEGGRVRRKKRKGSGEGQEVETLKIDGIEKLDSLKLKILLYLLFRKAGCRGLEYLMKKWITEGYIPLPYGLWYMDVPRSTRFLFEHTILSILYYLGSTDEQLEKIYDEMYFKYRDKIEDPGDNWNNIIYNIDSGTLNLIRKGRCPFCLLSGQGKICPSYPLARIKKISKDYTERLIRRISQ